jgi:uncharacterized membrane protein
MNNRRVFEALSLACVVACAALAAYAYAALPATITTHFDIAGTADAHGPKAVVWLGALFAVILFLVLSAVQLIPPRYSSYPVAVTDRNRELLYSLQREMLAASKLTAMLVGLALEWGIFASAERGSLDPLFVPSMVVTFVITIATSLYYVVKMRSA